MTGPQWTVGAIPWSTRQTDASGVAWICTKREPGGRVLHWETVEFPLRKARTEIGAGHPGYPSDEAVLVEQREQDRDRRAAARARARMGLVP